MSMNRMLGQSSSPLLDLTSGSQQASPLSQRESATTDGLSPAANHAVVRDLAHLNCVQQQETSTRIVATIYCNTSSTPQAHPYADHTLPPQPVNRLSTPAIAEGSDPNTGSSKILLEGPIAQSECPNRLHSSHISQSCLDRFLAVVEDLLGYNMPEHQQRLVSTHRCLALDSDRPRVVEVVLSLASDSHHLSFHELRKHQSIQKFEREWNCEVIFQHNSVHRCHKRLVVFDMDSTLIQQEVIDEIAAFIGVQQQVSEITERAMNGELDFSASLKARVALLKGVPSDVFEQLKPKIMITPGARELCKAFKRLGCSLAVLSGGFQPLAEWLAEELGLDHAFANHLLTDSESKTLTGELDPAYPIVNAEHKRNLLIGLAKGKDIKMEQTMAVGDGANDLPMLLASGIGVALKAKPKVQIEAPARLNVGESMLDLIYLLGFTQREVAELLID